MTASQALRRCADVADNVALGDRMNAIMVLWASAGERAMLGTLTEEDARALLVLLRG